MKSISIAAPVFNEELNIKKCVENWVAVLNRLSIEDYEIILCDDKSTDNSVNLIEELNKQNPKIKLVKHKHNQGAAKAVITAGNNATKDRILFVDSDGQFPPESIEAVISCSNHNPSSCIFGARQTKEDSFLTKTGTKLTTFIFNRIYGRNLGDISCILKIFPRDVFNGIGFESTGLNVSTEMSCRALEKGVDIVEQKVSHRPREFGTSSAAGIKFIKHALKRLIILKYFMTRKFLEKLDVLSFK